MSPDWLQRSMVFVDRIWRTLATGHCFAFLFVGGFLLAISALPITRLLGRSPAEKDARARRLIHHTFRFYLWQMEALGLMHLRIHGREHLAQAAGKLVIANHPSLLDVVILISLMPDCDCIVKGALRKSLVSGVIRATGYTDNSNGDTMLSRCAHSLAAGFPLIVFPEGTRSTPGTALQFQRGAANIAVRCHADILPIVITCEPPTLLKDEPWYKIPAQKPVFSVKIFPALATSTLIEASASPALATRQLNRYLLNFYQQQLHPRSNSPTQEIY
ncbi:MAG: 1-acyl-sn-glycerol-3-phosphate acyltransferase [Pseudomonadales bacterium]|nr:1-acyl-sn-glycerol-3-phosphate acyltransferase [Pseudomonadales bacterium]